MTIAPDTLFASKSGMQRLTQGDADIFHRMMCINVQVPDGKNGQINSPMPGDLVEHVFQERNSGLQVAVALAIQVHLDLDTGFQRISFDMGNAWSHEQMLMQIRKEKQYTARKSVEEQQTYAVPGLFEKISVITIQVPQCLMHKPCGCAASSV
jgi:hypothetical protein